MNVKLLLSKHRLLALLTVMIFSAFSKNVLAQSILVKGKVTSSTGENLAGATVIVKGTSTGTSTDHQGIFQLNVTKGTETLVISYTGMISKEIALRGRTSLDIKLDSSDTKALSEVVVVGYGSQRRRDLTGAVETVDMKDVTKAPVASFTEALAGRVAGVQVSSNDAQPGSTPNIIIRGAGSLTQSSSPLYVVDGFPMEDFLPGSISNEDIKSISILKDASATAIYGSRAANGVVVIETKKGRLGKPIIDFSTSQGIQQVGKRMAVMSPYEFIKYNYEFDSATTAARYFLNGKTLDSYKNVQGIDWQDEVFQTSPMSSYNIGLRGGSENTSYSVSGSIFNRKGVILNTGSSNYQGRLALDHKVSKNFNAGVNANYSYIKTYGVQAATSIGAGQESSYLFYNIWGYRPLSGNDSINLLDEDVDPDNIGVGSAVVNPVKSLQNTYNVTATRSLLTNAYLSYNIVKGLTLRITGGIDNRLVQNDQFFNSLTPQGSPKNPNNTRGINGGFTTTERNTWSNENLLNYKNIINEDHTLDVLAGFSEQKARVSLRGAQTSFIPNEELGISGIDEGVPYSTVSSVSENTLTSFFGRINYGFRSKYLLTVTFRGDGTSKFAQGKKWGYFPSGAFAWNMKEESFLQGLGFLSTAKLRTSYGVTGNNRVSDFAYLPALALTIPSAYSFGNSTPTQGAIPTSIGNADLKWETTHQADIGIDLGFMHDRILFTADVYRKTTTDLLLNAQLPPSTGFNTVYNNIGKLKNEGLELSLNTINIQTSRFTWVTNLNISFNSNEVLALTKGQQDLYSFNTLRLFNRTPLWVAQVGGPAASFYGFTYDGAYQYSDFDQPSPGTYLLKASVPTNGTPRANIKPGDVKYKDLNGDGTVDDNDLSVIGRGLPIHTGGFTNNFRFKGFDLSVFFQWSYGNKIMNANRVLFEGNAFSVVDKNQFASYVNRWEPDNPTNANFRAGGSGPQGRFSTRTLEDGSYLRLKTASLGYNLPAGLIRRLLLSNLRIGVAAQNLLTWTRYSGMDPEVSVLNTVLTPGYDFSAYPNYRTVVFTLSASF